MDTAPPFVMLSLPVPHTPTPIEIVALSMPVPSTVTAPEFDGALKPRNTWDAVAPAALIRAAPPLSICAYLLLLGTPADQLLDVYQSPTPSSQRVGFCAVAEPLIPMRAYVNAALRTVILKTSILAFFTFLAINSIRHLRSPLCSGVRGILFLGGGICSLLSSRAAIESLRG